MKKAYTKPMVMIESFELSQHIAACHFQVTNKNQAIKDGCNGEVNDIFGNIKLFYHAIANNQCEQDGEDIYCYTTGGPANSVFSS